MKRETKQAKQLREDLTYLEADIACHQKSLENYKNATKAELKANRSIPYFITVYTQIIKDLKKEQKALNKHASLAQR